MGPTTPVLPGERPTDPDPHRRRRASWIAAGAFGLLCLVFWVYVLFVYDPGLLVDELEDRTFPNAAEEICAATMVRLEALPRAETAANAAERAQTLEEANTLLASMVAELRALEEANTLLASMVAELLALEPTEPPEAAEAVGEWLDDWDTHVQDRRDYAERLRTDETARFTETPKGTRQVSRAIDGFAQVNRMRSCETPGDVG